MARPVFETYKDDAGKWKWILKTPNGETIASSSQGYEKQVDCLRRIKALGFLVPLAITSFTEEVQKRDVLGYSKQVFFSHSSKDEELISLIKLAFQLTPVKPYFARSEKAGRNPADKIVNEIDNSGALFALITSNVFDNQETLFWVLFEAGVAKGKDKPVYAWIEEGCDVPQCFNYITDYDRFKPDDYKECHKTVSQMLSIALKL